MILFRKTKDIMSLQLKMYLLIFGMFAILYGLFVIGGNLLGVGSILSYLILALLILVIQYFTSPFLISSMMRIKWVSEEEAPELHQMVKELSREAKIPKPKIGIASISIPNAFAFGRSLNDGRVCITEGIRNLLTKEELKAVLGHEISHLKNKDMVVMTLLSVIPLVMYWIAWRFLWGGFLDDRRERGLSILIGILAMIIYFLTNLLVLAGSRIREYYADEGSVKLGNPPRYLASALYKLVYSSAKMRGLPHCQNELRKIQALRGFFLNDINRSEEEIQELREVDKDLSGDIDEKELAILRRKKIKLSREEKIMEIFTTHPNTLKRIRRLAALA